MSRVVAILASVLLLSCVINHFHGIGSFLGERETVLPASYAEGTETTWIRTADGWEPSRVVAAQPRQRHDPGLHPLLVAGFLLTASLFVLVAFSGKDDKTGQIVQQYVLVRRKSTGKRRSATASA